MSREQKLIGILLLVAGAAWLLFHNLLKKPDADVSASGAAIEAQTPDNYVSPQPLPSAGGVSLEFNFGAALPNSTITPPSSIKPLVIQSSTPPAAGATCGSGCGGCGGDCSSTNQYVTPNTFLKAMTPTVVDSISNNIDSFSHNYPAKTMVVQ